MEQGAIKEERPYITRSVAMITPRSSHCRHNYAEKIGIQTSGIPRQVNKIGTNVPIFIAATGKAVLCAFLILIAATGSRNATKLKHHLGSHRDLNSDSLSS